jgi:hypothetical protein
MLSGANHLPTRDRNRQPLQNVYDLALDFFYFSKKGEDIVMTIFSSHS